MEPFNRIFRSKYKRLNNIGIKLAITSTLTASLLVGNIISPEFTSLTTHAAAYQLEDQLLKAANQYAGTPYQYGADPSQTNTFDCSSYTMRVFSELGITLPRTSSEQYALGYRIPMQEAQIGDLIFFSENGSQVPSHVGIYTGHNNMINATVSKGVITVDMTTSYWQSRFLGIKRIIPNHITIKNGDTLWKISEQTGTSLSNLQQWNQLNGHYLAAGQTLYIENPNLAKRSFLPEAKGDGNQIHTVGPGDTLWRIASRHNATIQQLKDWNKLTGDMIMPGQQLYVAAPATKYIVQSGDMLWLISQQTGVTIKAIKERNQLTSDLLFVGQVLWIPKQQS